MERLGLMTNTPAESARIWLDRFQRGDSKYPQHIGQFWGDLINAGLLLADLGIDEAKLEELRRLGIKTAAQEWLDCIRGRKYKYDVCVVYLRQVLKNSGFSLADIGTTEAELEELRIDYFKTAAQAQLKCLRDGTSGYKRHMQLLYQEVKNGNLSLIYIGTDDLEIMGLCIKGCKIAAEMWLDCLRKRNSHFHAYLEHLRAELHNSLLLLEDIGTSEEELASLAP